MAGLFNFVDLSSTAYRQIQKGLKLSLRGNGQKYFVHIRTKGTFLPWQYYQQELCIGRRLVGEGDAVNQSLKNPSRRSHKKTIDPKNIRLIAIVAFGRDMRPKLMLEKSAFLDARFIN